MSDLNVTLSAPVALAVQCALERHLSELYQASLRMTGFAAEVNADAIARAEAAHAILIAALYPDPQPGNHYAGMPDPWDARKAELDALQLADIR